MVKGSKGLSRRSFLKVGGVGAGGYRQLAWFVGRGSEPTCPGVRRSAGARKWTS